ncbi:MAG: flagellar basal body rod protein FlgC [Alphaproteobacteria bacterium]|nr:flagellar basal body rod protein FlgC [Alphaproteobacteria bacterium]
MDLARSMKIAAAGLDAQATRLKTVSENLANANSTATAPGGLPYRRKVVTFTNVLDRALDAQLVKVNRVQEAGGDFERHYDPSHPAADKDGYVLTPNVNPLLELMDMREAQRSYQANLDVIDAAKTMVSRTLDLLHG